MQLFYSQMKQALKRLMKQPGFFFTVVLTLGLSSGAFICAFTLNYLLWVKPLSYPKAESLYFLGNVKTYENQSIRSHAQTLPAIETWYTKQTLFPSMAMVHMQQSQIVSHPEQPMFELAAVTPEYFSLLDMPLHFGRVFSDIAYDEKRPEVVLSYEFWESHYQKSKAILGQKIQIDRVWFTVVGVVEKDFFAIDYTQQNNPVGWIPWAYHKGSPHWGNTTDDLYGIADIQEKAAIPSIRSSLTQMIHEPFLEAMRGSNIQSTLSADVLPVREALLKNQSKSSVLLFLGALVLFFIACLNITSLLTTRFHEQKRLYMIHAAIGASPFQLAIIVFSEILLFVICSLGVGMIVAAWGIEGLKAYLAPIESIPRVNELELSLESIVFSIVLLVLMSFIVTALIVKKLGFLLIYQQIATSGKGIVQQVSDQHQRLIIMGQSLFALTIVCVSSVLLKGAIDKVYQQTGFNESGLYFAHLANDRPNVTDQEAWSVLQILAERLSNQGDIKGASIVMQPPLTVGRSSTSFSDVNGNFVGDYRMNEVDHNYFDLIELPFVKGRAMTRQEVHDDEKVVIVNESAAQLLGGGQPIIGQSIFNWRGSLKVIGVVKDIDMPNDESTKRKARVYFPIHQNVLRIMIRMKPGASLQFAQFKKIINQVDPQMRLLRLRSQQETKAKLLYTDKVQAVFAFSILVIAIGLSMIGIYGVISFNTRQRRYELGVRISLGAQSTTIISMLLWECLKPMCVGGLIGLGLSAFIYGISLQFFTIELEPVTILMATLAMAGFGLLACYLPTRKVLADDPVKALKQN